MMPPGCYNRIVRDILPSTRYVLSSLRIEILRMYSYRLGSKSRGQVLVVCTNGRHDIKFGFDSLDGQILVLLLVQICF